MPMVHKDLCFLCEAAKNKLLVGFPLSNVGFYQRKFYNRIVGVFHLVLCPQVCRVQSSITTHLKLA